MWYDKYGQLARQTPPIAHYSAILPPVTAQPHLIDLLLSRKINPGKVFNLELPIDDMAEGYKAMDERRAIKTLLQV